MPRPKRTLHSTITSTLTPPSVLPPTQSLARVLRAAGNNLYQVELPPTEAAGTAPASATGTTASTTTVLVELPSRFRNTIWIKRGSYVVVEREDASADGAAGRANKVWGEIANVVGDEKVWRRMGYWPAAFAAKTTTDRDYEDGGEEDEDSEDEDGGRSNVGRMPPSESEGEDEEEEEGGK